MADYLRDTLHAIDGAAALLKRAGFELRYTSMKSEACYYGWPGRTSVIRVATHSQKHAPKEWRGMPVAAKITIGGAHLVRSGALRIADDKLRSMVARAIGNYFLSAVAPEPSP